MAGARSGGRPKVPAVFSERAPLMRRAAQQLMKAVWASAKGQAPLPRDIVAQFMDQAYAKGQGGTAQRSYFAKDASDNAPAAEDRRDGAPVPHELREVIAQGMTVTVIHRIGPARGNPEMDVIDVFKIKDGRIVRRDRYPTRFTQ